MEKVLFFVPHEDDELFIGGPMILNLTGNGRYEVSVVIVTNGDYKELDSSRRINESLSGLNLMGVKEENVFFLGYGDEWNGKHIYNSGDKELKTSIAGHKETYLPNEKKKEWAMQAYGKHQPYIRDCVVVDICNVINHIRPDVIVNVDLDEHPDHKATSLFVDEALRVILITDTLYKPKYLKKYAYNGMLSGKKRHSFKINNETLIENNKCGNPYHNSFNMIRYEIPSCCKTILLENNYLYRISKEYLSQGIWMAADKYINSDIVYWQQNVCNYALHASINVTSGEKKWINDFKLLDTENVRNTNVNNRNCAWIPNCNDENKEISLDFHNDVKVGIINIYFDNDVPINCAIVRGYLNSKLCREEVFDVLYTGKICHKLIFNTPFVASEIKISFPDVIGEIAINELEILSAEEEPPFKEFLLTSSSKNRKDYYLCFIKLLNSYLFRIKRFIFRKMTQH